MIEEHLIREFIAEAEEHLHLVEPQLLQLEKEPDNSALIHDIFLATHNIKGTASYVGLTHISHFTHLLESLLDRARKEELRISSELIDVLLEGVDTLKRLIQHVSAGYPLPDTSIIETKLTQWNEPQGSAKHKKDRHGFQVLSDPSVSSVFQADVMKMLDHEDVEIYADIASQQIECMRLSLDMIRENVGAGHDSNQEQIVASISSLVKAFRNLQTSAAVLELDTLDALLDDQVRHIAPLENSLRSKVSSSLTEAELIAVEQIIHTLENLTETMVNWNREDTPVPQPSQPVISETPGIDTFLGPHMLRVDADRVDYLLNLVGELVINRARLMRVSNVMKHLYETLRTGETSFLSPLPSQRKKTLRLFKTLKDTLNEVTMDLGRLTNQLQEGTMRIRMIPISQVIGRFPRMVRDLSRQAGKEVEIEIHGADTELDKTVMDIIGDPLIHILRNAIDHGIESPAERQAQGKPIQGKIILSVYHQGNQVMIEVEDDGKGIDLNLVKEKAIQQQLIAAQEADKLRDQEIASLIFHTGFSTVETVSHLSGRGVGLHIVKRYLEQLNGSIELEATPGKGSTFTIKLPLTLAIIPALMVEVKSEVFAVPLVSVEEAVRISPQDINTIQSHKVIRLRDQTIPLLELTELLGEPVFDSQDLKRTSRSEELIFEYSRQETLWTDTDLLQDEEKLSAVVVSDGLQQIGLVVDAFIGESDIVIKSLDNEFINVEGVSGASIQGDGQIALVLDAASLIDLASKRRESA